MGVRLTRALLVLVLGLMMTTGVVSCSRADSEDILIGYLGPLSGRSSSLGLMGRDGALLAVEQINASGGINGRQVVLEAVDDARGSGEAVAGVRDLARRGAVAVIGPMTSSSVDDVLQVANELSLPLVSPTVSSTDFTGIDDYFIRICPDNRAYAKQLAAMFAGQMGCGSVAVVYDETNASYARVLAEHFAEEAQLLGCEVVGITSFSAHADLSYSDIAEEAIATAPDAVFLIANSIDSGLFAQRIKLLDPETTLLLSQWSVSSIGVIETGGSAVEGALYLNTYNPMSKDPGYIEVREAFLDRFARIPEFAAIHSYDTTMLLGKIVAESGNDADIKLEITQFGPYAGVAGEFQIDGSGDTDRSFYPMTIRDGAFAPYRP